ncbi:MAG: tetratricopeptide repeat protein [Candidatus Riflebacteria bacterium]|nr:tetratricopeptide repeat protein [Candidatus Riflebacteria bacterium]
MEKKLIILIVLIPTVMFFTGCSGGVAGEGSNSYPQTNGTPIVRANSYNDQGWDLITKGQYDSAINTFNKVLGDNPTSDEAAEANNGLGWARAHLGSLSDGGTYFQKAIDTSNDAKVGLAAAHIQMGSKADLDIAVDLLYNKLGGGNPHFHYVPRRPTGVSDAQCHALLAYAFAGSGHQDDATTQLDYAKELDTNWANTTIDQIGKVVEFLNK